MKLLLAALSNYLAGLLWIIPGMAFCGLLFLPMLVMGRWISFGMFLMVRRIKNEEALLETALPGYRDYQKKVRSRVIPFLW